jgi:hypothetical protein
MLLIKDLSDKYAVYFTSTDEYGEDREYPYILTDDGVEIEEFATKQEALVAAKEYEQAYREEQVEEETNDARDEAQDAISDLSNLIGDCNDLTTLQEIKAALLALTARFQD